MHRKEKIGIKTNLDIHTTLALIASYNKENFILYLFWCICGKLWGGQCLKSGMYLAMPVNHTLNKT
jgi:hypothetical protein